MDTGDNSPYAAVEKSIRSLQSEKFDLRTKLESVEAEVKNLSKKIQDRDKIVLDLKVHNEQLLEQHDADGRQREILGDLVFAEGQKAEFLANALQSFEATIGSLRDRVISANESNKAIKVLVMKMEKVIGMVTKKNADLHVNLKKNRTLMTQLKQTVKEFQKRNQLQTAQLQTLQMEKKELERASKETDEKLQQIKEDNQTLVQTTLKMTKERDEVSEALIEYQKISTMQMESLQSKTVELEQSVLKLYQEKEELNEVLAEQKQTSMTQIDQLQTKIVEFEENSSKISKEKDEVTQAFAEYQKKSEMQMESLQTKMEALELSSTKMANEKDEVSETFAKFQKTTTMEMDALQAKIIDLEQTSSKLSKEKEEISQALADHQKTTAVQIDSLQAKIVDLEVDIVNKENTFKNEVVVLEQFAIEVRLEVQALEAQIEELLSALGTQKTESTARISELESSLVRVKSELTKQQQLLEKTVKAQQSERQEKDNILAAVENEYEELKQRYASKEQDIKTALEKREDMNVAYLNLQQTSEHDKSHLEQKILELESSVSRMKATLGKEKESLKKDIEVYRSKEGQMLKSLAEAQVKLQGIGGEKTGIEFKGSQSIATKRSASPGFTKNEPPLKKKGITGNKLEVLKKMNSSKTLKRPQRGDTKKANAGPGSSTKYSVGRKLTKTAPKNAISSIKSVDYFSIFSDTSLSEDEADADFKTKKPIKTFANRIKNL